jgi:hypothetical protein
MPAMMPPIILPLLVLATENANNAANTTDAGGSSTFNGDVGPSVPVMLGEIAGITLLIVLIFALIVYVIHRIVDR